MTKTITFPLSDELHIKLKTYCIQNNIRMKNALVLAIELLINNKHLKKQHKTAKDINILHTAQLRTIESSYNVKHNFTSAEWIAKSKKTKGICPVCKKKKKMTMHHTPPISFAPFKFVYLLKDVQPMCLRCNAVKGNR